MGKDKINALGVRRIEADLLGNCLMEKDSQSTSPPAQIAEFLQQFFPLKLFGSWS